MKKNSLFQFLMFSLVGLVTFSTIEWTDSFPDTEPVDNSIAWSSPIPSSSLIWPSQGIISQGFNTFHEGIDIAGAAGTPIVAAASGEVVFVGWDDWGLGNMVEIQHPDGSRTLYGHNQSLLVRKGQQVSQGQVIAKMGSTGNSTAPHLHFEVHPGGRAAVNPMSLLPPLVAGRIPSAQPIAAAPVPVAPTPGVSNPVAVGRGCNGDVVLNGETANFWVRVCRENGQLFYIGQPKQNPNLAMRLPARRTGEGQYRAENGSYSYDVSPERIVVWQNGRQIRSERLSNRRSQTRTSVLLTSVEPEPLSFDITSTPVIPAPVVVPKSYPLNLKAVPLTTAEPEPLRFDVTLPPTASYPKGGQDRRD